MGCDIHGPFIEVQVYSSNLGEAWALVSELDGNRDYRAFGLMAGVRFRAAPVVPTHRGIPDNATWQVKEHVEKWAGWYEGGGCHSASWLTLAELRTVAKAYLKPTPDLDDPSGEVPNTTGWRSFVDVCIVLMEEVERRSGNPTRAIFCFDN